MIPTLATRPAHAGGKGRALAGLVVVAVVLTLAILVDSALSYNRIHSGVTIGSLDVGRMTREEATARLADLVRETEANQVVLTSKKQDWHVLPKDVGTKIDVAGTVEQAYALTRERSFGADVATRLRLYLSGREVALRGTVDTAKMDDLLARVGKTLDVPPVNAALTVKNGAVQVTEGRDGSVVDRARLRDQLKALLLSLHATELAVPIKVQPPHIQAADAKEAETQVRTMLTAAVELRAGEQKWTMSPKQTETYVDFRVEGKGDASKLVAFVSPKKAAPLFAEVKGSVEREARKATWETDGQTASLIPSQGGQAVDTTKTADNLTKAALSSTARVAQVTIKETQPSRTTEAAKAMGIVSRLGGFTTEFDGSANRISNVQRAAAKINGTLLGPGEQFDFDATVGRRTAENGFKTAPTIIAGKLEDTLGGGICQVATTLFNAVFFAGLEVTARTNHSLYISHYPMGRDATVSWGGPAFRFRNDTPHWLLIKSAASDSSLTFVIYGTPENREVTYTTSDWYDLEPLTEKKAGNPDLSAGARRVTDEGQTGRSVKVVRKVTKGDQVIHHDTFVSRYPMYPRVIEEGPKAATTTTTKPTTPTTNPAPTTTNPPATTTTGG